MVVVASILLLILLFPLLFYLRRRVELRLENDMLVLEYPLSTKRIDLETELQHWSIQSAHYIRWGFFSSIIMVFKDGRRVTVSSMFNQKNYDLLYKHLSSRFPERENAAQYF